MGEGPTKWALKIYGLGNGMPAEILIHRAGAKNPSNPQELRCLLSVLNPRLDRYRLVFDFEEYVKEPRRKWTDLNFFMARCS